MVHLLAPSDEYAARFDCLVPETALRLTAIDLAARCSKYARFWPVDQLQQVPQDAYPRVQISFEKMPPLPHVKLIRRGDTFLFMASADGKDYLLLSSANVPMAAEVSVGTWGRYDPQGKPSRTSARNVQLNGRPVASPQKNAVGKALKPSQIQVSEGEWVIETYGMEPPSQNDYRERGEFLCSPTKGDFELAATIDMSKTEEGAYRGGLMCREGPGLDAPMAGLILIGESVWPISRVKPYRYPRCQAAIETHLLHADLKTSPDKSRRIVSLAVSCMDWETLTGCIEKISRRLTEDLVKELHLPGGAPAASPATADQLAQLDKARQLTLKVCSRDVLAGSRKVDAVLDAAPLCAEAHYTAALCGSILACQDLYGRFHERGRFLAGPLSHRMYARGLKAPTRPQDRLSEAWAMLACGYPNAAAASLEGLSEGPEVQAIRMFITRDYRPMLRPESGEPTDIESLALLWAAQQCGRTDLLEGACSKLIGKTRSPAFSTLYSSADFRAPSEAISMALARDANDILGDSRIPADKRMETGTALARPLLVDAATDPAKLGTAIAWKIQQQGYMLQGESGQTLSQIVAGMVNLYALGAATATGPVSGAAGMQWQCLCPHDLAQVQRGLLLVTFNVQIRSLAHCLGVPQEAQQLCEAIAKGLEKLPGIDAYFRGFGLIQVQQYDKATEEAGRLLQSPLVKPLAARNMLIMNWDNRVLPKQDKSEYLFGRGGWDWADRAVGTMWDGQAQLSESLAWRCLAVDSHASLPLQVLLWKAQTPDVAEPFLDRLPYNLSVLEDAARAANNYGRSFKAIEVYRKIIDLIPRDARGYEYLAWQYVWTDNLDEAINVARQAKRKCEFSIRLSNLLGSAVDWLVEQHHLEEAMAFGQESAKSYSYQGLRGLAVALVANKQVDKAQDIYRKLAHRYDSGTVEYIRFLLEQHRSQAFMDEEVTALLKEYPKLKDAIADHVGKACCQATADPKVLEAFYAGPLSFYNKDWQQHKLLECAVYARQFNKAVEYGIALHDAKQLTVYERMWLHAAMRLSGKTGRIADVEAVLLKQVESADVSEHVLYALKRTSWKQLQEISTASYPRSYAFWLRGVEAELRQDMPAAIEAYQTAGEGANDGDAKWISWHWRVALERQQAAATQKASVQQADKE